MNRPGFTVEKKNGINFDANHIFYSWKSGKGWCMFFVCSGSIEEIPVEEVKEVRFSPYGPN